jgi:LmbE family N-acetylglucosaminyl deacetylase
MTPELTGAGTPEQDWQNWRDLHLWPVLSLAKWPSTVIVVAPHPDDEVLGVGGLLALLARAGSRIHVIAVTDGEASHPDSPTMTAEALAARRTQETRQALAVLGATSAVVERLRLPDGGVSRHESQNANVTAAVIRKLAMTQHEGEAWCLVPWSGDGHPDHEASGLAATSGANGTARVFAYPVWMWHWAAPGDGRVPWSYARRIVLPDDIQAAKQAAIQAFQSQISPLSDDPADAAILAPHVLARLTRNEEVVFEVGSR